MAAVTSAIPQHQPYKTRTGQLHPPLVNTQDRVVICSISDMDLIGKCGLPPDERVISARGDAPYALTEVFGQTELYDMGDDNQSERYWTAKQIALSLLCIHNPEGSLVREGAFLCAGEMPTQKELNDAASARTAFFLKLVQDADTEYARNPNKPELISDRQRRAGKSLGLKKPWLVVLEVPTVCPACAEQVQPQAVKCRFCGFIINKERAAELGMLENPAVPANGEEEAEANLVRKARSK